MSKQVINIKADRLDTLAILCESAKYIVEQLDGIADMRLSVDGISVRNCKPEEPCDMAFNVEHEHGHLVVNGTESMDSLLLVLAKAMAIIEMDAGGPNHVFSGVLNTVDFSVSWDTEFNVKIERNE